MKQGIVALLLLWSGLVFSQAITWTDVSSTYNLPNGVKLLKGSRMSPKLQAWIVDVDLSVKTIALRPYLVGANTLPKLAESTGAILAVNGGFFSGTTSLSTVVYPKEIKSRNVASLARSGQNYPVVRSLFSLDTEFRPSVDWIYHYGDKVSDLYKFNAPLVYAANDPTPLTPPTKAEGSPMDSILVGIGGAPILIKSGLLQITYNEEIMWGSGVGLTNRDPRTAVGYTADNHVILMVADGRTTVSDGLSLIEVGEELLKLKCVAAMNLDGGGSSGLANKSGYISTPSEFRIIPTMLAVVNRDSIPQEKKPTYDEILDTESSKTKRIGSWSESANTGFYGASRSLISGKGSGSSEVAYGFSPPKNAICEVYAWWVASSNRGKDTPYTIKHKNGETRVRVDQTGNGSKWNLLGKFPFKGDGTDTIKVSNDATVGDFVVADALRLTSYNEFDAVSPVVKVGEVEIKVYPNPTSDIVMIKMADAERAKISVFNQLGQLVNVNIETSPDGYILDLSGENRGIYHVNISIDGTSANTKIVKF